MDFWRWQKCQRGLIEGRNHDSDRRDIYRLHHEPGRQCSLGSVSHSSHTPFHYTTSFVFDGNFPRTGQEGAEDTPKQKRENRKDFTRGYSESIQFLNLWSSVGMSLPHAASCLWRGLVCLR